MIIQAKPIAPVVESMKYEGTISEEEHVFLTSFGSYIIFEDGTMGIREPYKSIVFVEQGEYIVKKPNNIVVMSSENFKKEFYIFEEIIDDPEGSQNYRETVERELLSHCLTNECEQCKVYIANGGKIPAITRRLGSTDCFCRANASKMFDFIMMKNAKRSIPKVGNDDFKWIW